MNLTELKELAKRLGGVLVMNGTVPEFVILSYAGYQKLESTSHPGFSGQNRPAPVPTAEESVEIEKLNKEILALKEEIRQKEEGELLETPETVSGENSVDEITPENENQEGSA